MIAALSLSLALSCGGDPGPPDEPAIDADGDGFSVDVDCQDDARDVHPDAPEACDFIDNNCNGQVDEGWDVDGDLWTTCNGDCRDQDAASNPVGVEVEDGFDNDCDGVIDENTDAFDDDGDGFSENQGDCDDRAADGGALINPGAVEVQLDAAGDPDGVDDNCNGLIDEPLEPCAPGGDPDVPMSYAHAIDACQFTTGASWDDALHIDPRSRGVFSRYGDTYVPEAGDDFAVLATGLVGDASTPGFVILQPGTEFTNQVPHPEPLPAGAGCSQNDPTTVNDYSEVALRIRVPTNAVGISFDEIGNRVTINVGFFDVCDPIHDPVTCVGAGDLIGTGYEAEGGGTGWLTTTAPVTPGEKITLRFAIFDEGDHSLDSAVIIDNFRWEIDEFTCPDGSSPPCTIDVQAAPQSRFVTRAAARRAL